MNFNRQPGRPEAASHKDPYEILGVKRGASKDEIRSAYRNLAKKWHPDLHIGDKAAEEKFKTITGAYELLSEQKPKEFDLFGGTGFPQSSTSGKRETISGIEAIVAHINNLEIPALVSLMNQSNMLTLSEQDFKKITDAATRRFRDIIHDTSRSKASEFKQGLKELHDRASGRMQKVYGDWMRLTGEADSVRIKFPWGK